MLWRFRKEIILIIGVFLSFIVHKNSLKISSINLKESSKVEVPVNYQETIQENKRLRKILKLKEKEPIFSKVIIGEVISIKPSVCPGEIIVNKGNKDGIEKNMAVISLNGYLIGRVVEVKEDSSKILTIFYPKSKISAMVQRTREIGVVEGGPFPIISFKYLSNESNAKEGDEIVTASYSEFFPKGIKIGKIVAIKRMKEDFFLQASVKPFSGFSSLDEVIIGK